jgi:hypothetical protein
MTVLAKASSNLTDRPVFERLRLRPIVAAVPSALSLTLVIIKLFLYRPWRPLGLREVEAPTFSDIGLIDGGKVVSPTRRPLFTPRKIPGTHFC